jgi:hypothetical protein
MPYFRPSIFQLVLVDAFWLLSLHGLLMGGVVGFVATLSTEVGVNKRVVLPMPEPGFGSTLEKRPLRHVNLKLVATIGGSALIWISYFCARWFFRDAELRVHLVAPRLAASVACVFVLAILVLTRVGLFGSNALDFIEIRLN